MKTKTLLTILMTCVISIFMDCAGASLENISKNAEIIDIAGSLDQSPLLSSDGKFLLRKIGETTLKIDVIPVDITPTVVSKNSAVINEKYPMTTIGFIGDTHLIYALQNVEIQGQKEFYRSQLKIWNVDELMAPNHKDTNAKYDFNFTKSLAEFEVLARDKRLILYSSKRIIIFKVPSGNPGGIYDEIDTEKIFNAPGKEEFSFVDLSPDDNFLLVGKKDAEVKVIYIGEGHSKNQVVATISIKSKLGGFCDVVSGKFTSQRIWLLDDKGLKFVNATISSLGEQSFFSEYSASDMLSQSNIDPDHSLNLRVNQNYAVSFNSAHELTVYKIVESGEKWQHIRHGFKKVIWADFTEGELTVATVEKQAVTVYKLDAKAHWVIQAQMLTPYAARVFSKNGKVALIFNGRTFKGFRL